VRERDLMCFEFLSGCERNRMREKQCNCVLLFPTLKIERERKRGCKHRDDG
jgi:hypothetical protein